MTHTVGSQEGYDDPEHQEREKTLNITNKSPETVEVIRLLIINPLLPENEPVLEIKPEVPILSLTQGQSHTLHARQPRLSI